MGKRSRTDAVTSGGKYPGLKRWIAREIFGLEHEDAIHAVLEDRVKLKAFFLEEKRGGKQ